MARSFIVLEQAGFQTCMECTRKAAEQPSETRTYTGEAGAVAHNNGALTCARGLDCALPKRLQDIAATNDAGAKSQLIDDTTDEWMQGCIPEVAAFVAKGKKKADPLAVAASAT